EHRLHRRADRDVLRGIAEQVADHADPARLRQLDEDDDVGTMLLQRGMHGVPGPLPRVDAAARRDVHPLQVRAEAAVTNPFRAPLELAADAAALGPED